MIAVLEQDTTLHNILQAHHNAISSFYIHEDMGTVVSWPVPKFQSCYVV